MFEENKEPIIQSCTNCGKWIVNEHSRISIEWEEDKICTCSEDDNDIFDLSGDAWG